MAKYLLSIDQGTTGTTALLVDAKSLELIDKVNYEFKQIYPTPGQVEHDLNDIWLSVEQSVSKVLEKNKVNPKDIHSIGITNQRETTCAYTKKGEPLANAIVWQDRRTSEYCSHNQNKYNKLKPLTGLPLDPYFSGTKMRWFLDNNEKIQKELENKNLYFSTIDTFLLFKMSENNSFYTEPSNASRTLLMNLDTCDWDDSLLSFFEIPKDCLPEIKETFSNFGKTKGLSFLPDGIPISCILGDQQAALFGQAGYKNGDLKCTYGTGAFILLNTGENKTYSSNGLLTTVAYKHKGKACYALEGSSYIAGAAVQWLRDNLKIIKDANEVEALADSVTNLSEIRDLQFLPFFTGIGSPFWKPNVRASITGLTRDTNNNHLARVCLEGISLSINDSIKALLDDAPNEVTSIKVDGGACQNNLLMQIQSNFSKKTIIRPKVIETTAYGVALGSLVGLRELNFDEIDSLWKEDQSFSPEDNSYYAEKEKLWIQTVEKL